MATTFAVDVDQAVKAAVVARWKEDPTLANLAADGPKDGRLPSPQPDSYATIKAEPSGDNETVYGGGGVAVIARRKVTLGYYARRDLIAAGKAAMADVFKPSLYARLTRDGGPRCVGLRLVDAGATEEEPTKDAKGQEVWRGVWAFEIRFVFVDNGS